MIRILTISDKTEWASYVSQSAETDFYHTWHYHSLSSKGTALLCVYEEGPDFIAIPLIRRNIPESPYFDLTCVYGYSGPMSNKKMEAMDTALIINFKEAFLKFLSDGNYVSVFIRMHPFYNQDLLLNKIADVYENGKVVVMDLNGSIEDQRRKYSRTTLASVKSAIKKGYYIKEENSDAAIKVFKEIYDGNMKRIGAAEFYLFDEQHYSEMLNTTEYNARLFMVYKGDEVACSTIVVFKNEIIQSYLIGTKAEYLCDSPAKFLADGIGKIGRESGMRYFNLGGGLGFKKDSLFEWKRTFSDLFFEYKSWRYIANPTVYEHLLDQKGIDKDSKVDFFPLYRLA